MGRLIRAGKITTGLISILGFTTTLYSIGKVNYNTMSTNTNMTNKELDRETNIGLIGLMTGLISGFSYLEIYQFEKNKKNKNYHNNP